MIIISYCFLFAVLLHGCLLGFFLWGDHDSSHKKTELPIWTTAELVFRPKIVLKQPIRSKSGKIKKYAKPEMIAPITSSFEPEGLGGTFLNTTKEQNNKLLQLLNRKIEEHLVYPILAQKLNQTGVAKISFWLDVTGEISQPKVEISTSKAMLDNAALKTVQTINPVAEAKQWLNQKEQFVVDIHFE